MYGYDLILSRRRTLALEITREGRVLVRAPMNASQAHIDTFVAAHQDWLRRHLAERQRRLAERPPSQADIPTLKAKAREILPPKVAHWARQMGVCPTGVKITTARKRYGSCSGKNSLCFSCFLMEQPEAAIDLVVVHELCHITEKNHGPRFYALMDRWLPDHRERKKLLR